MGSSESSKCGVSDIGVDLTKKKMILYSHICCVKNYLKEGIKSSNNSLKDKIECPNEIRDFVKKIQEMLEEETVESEQIKKKIDDLSENEIYEIMSYDVKQKILSEFKLQEIDWKYNSSNFHRELRLKFKCKKCNTTKYVIMDKTTGGKNIAYGYKYYDSPWWHWKKYPKYTYDFNEIMNFFYNASNYYHGTRDNCMHFAYSIWDKIE